MIGINLATYRKKDWKRWMKVIDDSESMHDSWEDWYSAFLKMKKGFAFAGI